MQSGRKNDIIVKDDKVGKEVKLEDRKDIQEFARGILRNKVAYLTESEMRKFQWLFGKSVEEVKVEDIGKAIDICERTIKKKEHNGGGEATPALILFKEYLEKWEHR